MLCSSYFYHLDVVNLERFKNLLRLSELMAIDDHVADAGKYLKNIGKAEVHNIKTSIVYNTIQFAVSAALAYVGGVIGYNYAVGESLTGGLRAATTALGAGFGYYAGKIITFPIDVIQFFKHWYTRARALAGKPIHKEEKKEAPKPEKGAYGMEPTAA